MAAGNKGNIIRKIEVVEGGNHHGGAWKVAYADFMTAMMAFFLLMWILSSSDKQQLKGVAEYFTTATMPGGNGVLDGATIGPPGTLNASRGTTKTPGKEPIKKSDVPALWRISDASTKAMPKDKSIQVHAAEGIKKVKDEPVPTVHFTSSEAVTGSAKALNTSTSREKNRKIMERSHTDKNISHYQDNQRFARLEKQLRQAMQASQDLRPLMKNVIFEHTPEGLRIQVIDQKGRAMFPRGSSKLSPAAVHLMQALGKSLSVLPNHIVISGHTDSLPFSNRTSYDNWDLSTDRANEVRRVLESVGVAQKRFTRVSGLADTDPLYRDQPDNPANRRISVLLAYQKSKVDENINRKEAKITPTDIQPDHVQQTAAQIMKPNGKALYVEEPTLVVSLGTANAKTTPTEAKKRVQFRTASQEATPTIPPQVFDNLRSALQ